MCLIIHKPAGVEISKDLLAEVFEAHPDGLGIMWNKDGQKNHIHRTMPKTVDEVIKTYNQYRKKELGIHFRRRTRGDICKDNVHPFPVIPGVYMMHNGTITKGVDAKKDIGNNDTREFIEKMVRPLLTLEPKLVDSAEFNELLSEYVGSNNKLLFLNSAGDFKIVNEKSGSEFEIPNCWVSNTYTFTQKYTKAANPYGAGYTYDNNSKSANRTNFNFHGASKGENSIKLPTNEETKEYQPSNATYEDYMTASVDKLYEFILTQPEEAVEVMWELMSEVAFQEDPNYENHPRHIAG